MLQVVDYVEQVWFLNLSINKIKYLGLIQFDKKLILAKLQKQR
jgi:hypothetical protein